MENEINGALYKTNLYLGLILVCDNNNDKKDLLKESEIRKHMVFRYTKHDLYLPRIIRPEELVIYGMFNLALTIGKDDVKVKTTIDLENGTVKNEQTISAIDVYRLPKDMTVEDCIKEITKDGFWEVVK